VSHPGEPPVPPQGVEVRFDRPAGGYAPGDHLEARYRIFGWAAREVRFVEQSLGWYTEGKGEEDLGVQVFARVLPAPGADPQLEGTLAARLPASPLSYEGVIVKVRWCLRVRVFLAGGRDFLSEHVFTLGTLPPARAVRSGGDGSGPRES